jgi:hypothetical protein
MSIDQFPISTLGSPSYNILGEGRLCVIDPSLVARMALPDMGRAVVASH